MGRQVGSPAVVAWLRLGWGGVWDDERDGGSALAGVDGEGAVVGLGDGGDDGEAESAGIVPAGRNGLDERLLRPVADGGVDAGPVVLDGEGDAVVHLVGPGGGEGAGRCVEEGGGERGGGRVGEGMVGAAGGGR